MLISQDIDLTRREQDVLILVCRGLNNQEIAQHLSVSVSTVNNCMHHIFNKFRVANKGQAVIISLKQGLTGDEVKQKN